MANKELETKEPLIYTDGEVGGIMSTLGSIYALDDAIYNQKQLQRPETFVQPLIDMRRTLSEHLQVLSSKAEAPKSEQKP